jgi:hypothetical protein
MAVTPEWARVINTTHQQYVRQETVNVLRNDKLLATLESKGRITMGNSGNFVQWPVEFRLIPVNPYADMDTVTFQRHNTDVLAQVPWRGYTAPEAISKKERLMNVGMEAFVNIWNERLNKLVKAMRRHFAGELYIDGNATGNEKRLHGFESFTALNGTIQEGVAGATQRAANAADKAGYPSDTYAQLSTELGNKGGSWSGGSWPNGTGDSEFDYWSPLVVNTTSSAWTAAGTTFLDNAQEILRYAIIHSTKNSGKEGLIDMTLLHRNYYIDLQQAIENTQRVIVNRGRDESLLVKLGFGDVINFEGVDISHEYEVPASTGYGFNCDYMELKSLQNVLFDLEGPFYDEESKTWRETLDFFGNACYNPRHFFKLAELA